MNLRFTKYFSLEINNQSLEVLATIGDWCVMSGFLATQNMLQQDFVH